MHHTDAKNKKPTGDTTSPVGHTDRVIVVDDDQNDKAFFTQAAEFALAGYAFVRNEDGSLSVMRRCQIRPLADLGEAKRHLMQIGGPQ